MSAGFRFAETASQKEMPEILSAFHYSFVAPDKITYHCFQHDWVLNYPRELVALKECIGNSTEWLRRTPFLAHLYPPGLTVLENYQDAPYRNCRSDYIIFSAGRYDSALRKLCENTAGFCRFSDPENILGTLMQEIADQASGGEERVLAVNGTLNLIIDALLNFSSLSEKKDYMRRLSRERSLDMKNITMSEGITRIFNENPSDSFTLDSLAKRLHVSSSTLSHRYPEIHGETPMQTISRLRIELAKALMMKKIPLKTIASECGFCDEFHLMKTFRRHTGISLGEYRRTLQS